MSDIVEFESVVAVRDKAFPEFGLSVAVSCDDEIVRPYKGKDSPFAVLAACRWSICWCLLGVA